MPIQPIPEQGVAVIDDRDAAVIHVVDLRNDEKIIKSILLQPGDTEFVAETAHRLAKDIIAKPAIVHMARVAWGLESPRRLLPGGQPES